MHSKRLNKTQVNERKGGVTRRREGRTSLQWWWSVHTVKLLLKQFSPFLCYNVLLGCKHLRHNPRTKHLRHNPRDRHLTQDSSVRNFLAEWKTTASAQRTQRTQQTQSLKNSHFRASSNAQTFLCKFQLPEIMSAYNQEVTTFRRYLLPPRSWFFEKSIRPTRSVRKSINDGPLILSLLVTHLERPGKYALWDTPPVTGSDWVGRSLAFHNCLV
jgi:hypothetical protein